MIFNASTQGQRGAVDQYFNRRIKAPYVNTQVSTLGGVSNASAMIRGSLDPKHSWNNGILHNSQYFMISVGCDGEADMFARSFRLPKMRKFRATSLPDAVARINKYLASVK
jgi:hypothetical protein